jgi:hypothetical protein
MYYIIKFKLKKGEGHFPLSSECDLAQANLTYEQLIKSSMRFSFNNDNGLLPVVEWKLVDDGLSSLILTEDGYSSGPEPVVWLQLEEEVDTEDSNLWSDALISDYILKVPGSNDDDPFYFQDHNGNSQVESAEWLADEIFDHLSELVMNMSDDESIAYSNDLQIIRNTSTSDDGINLRLKLKKNDAEYYFTWCFENEDALNGFDFNNNEYADSKGCEAIEENSDIYAIHSIIMKHS